MPSTENRVTADKIFVCVAPKTCHIVENKTEEDFYMLAFSGEDFDPCVFISGVFFG